ncbi:MAG TPA: chorismate mutase [Gemmatimonadaceae bacterium]|jgi:chorismate mutase|nr:chorismate mutase [Gemmatimonadaceae bacterium]HEU6452185.1 chorismate mutase [Gemmatimonadaceae bacterium]
MGERKMRAVRGATTVEKDDADLVVSATRELLATLAERNAFAPEQVISAIFTVTPDITSEFPARAARELGWVDVPLLCALEIPTERGLAHCIRVLLHIETELPRSALRHVYLRDAVELRPDLSGGSRD